MKNIEYYQYETAKIHITWKGKVQPFGMFKTATAANTFCNKNVFFQDLKDCKIVTPDGTLPVEWDPEPIVNPYPTQY